VDASVLSSIARVSPFVLHPEKGHSRLPEVGLLDIRRQTCVAKGMTELLTSKIAGITEGWVVLALGLALSQDTRSFYVQQQVC